MSASVADLDLGGMDDDGDVPDERIKDAATARALFFAMYEADKGSALMRARHQAMLDGEPPYDAAVLAATGQASRTNVNWGDGEATMDMVMTGMIDRNVSVERLFRIPLRKSAVPDDETRANFEDIVSDEASRCVRAWSGFNWNYQYLAHNTFGYGVGFGYHDDPWDFRYKTTGLGNFVIPRATEASEDKIELAGMRVPYRATTLFAKIRNEAFATKVGWDVAAVKQALVKSHTAQSGTSTPDWQELQAQFKNNDLGAGGKCQTIPVLHLWVQEFDGSISLYGTTESALEGTGEADPWLFKQRSIYKEARHAFTAFTYGIGTNGTFHSISGILRKIYPQVQQINRSQCGLVDAVAISGGVMLQPVNEQAYSRMQYTSYGPITMLPAKEHGEVIPHTAPNLAGGMMPVISDMRQTIQRRAGQFTGDSGFGGQNVEKTRFQVQAELESLGKVGATQINLWDPPWERLLRETVRRLTRKGYPEKAPGGKEAHEFRRRLVERGFPLELLEAIDIEALTAEKAVGAGSGAARTATLHNLQELSGSLDAVGKHNLTRDLFAAALGGSYDLADRYIQRPEETRPPLDKTIANLENTLFKLGQEVPVEINQLHVIHLDTHLPYLAEMVQGVQDGQTQLLEIVVPMTVLWTHCVQHLENIQEDSFIHEKVGLYRQALNTAEEFVHNGQKELAAAQEEAAAAGGAGPNAEMSQELQLKFMEFQLKLQQIQQTAAVKEQIEERKAAQKAAHKAREFEQQAAFKDANNAAGMIATAQQAAQQRAEALKIAALKRGNARKKAS